MRSSEKTPDLIASVQEILDTLESITNPTIAGEHHVASSDVEKTSSNSAETEKDSPLNMITLDVVEQMLPDAPKRNLEKYLPLILKALGDFGLTDLRIGLMAIATVRAESAAFIPLDEGVSRYNTSPGGKPFDLYDRRAVLGNQGPPDGARFKGRGFIQLTGRYNYMKFSEKIDIGLQLVDKPELANNPEIAAKLLAAFIKEKEDDIHAALKSNDLRQARRSVNGGEHGLEQFKEAYRKGMELLDLKVA